MTAPKTGTPATSKPPVAKKKAPLTDAEKAARAALRKAEGSGVRFLRIAKPRVARALSALRRLETVGKSPAYDYTPEQAAAVMKYLDGAVEKVRMTFVNRVNKRAEETVTL